MDNEIKRARKSSAEGKVKTIEPNIREEIEIAAAVYEEDEGGKRIAALRAERQARGAPKGQVLNQKLSVPEDKKDPRFVYRMVLDAGNRIHDLKAKDWDIAPGDTAPNDPRNMGMGSVVERMGNVRTVPKPEKHVLMRKPKEFYDEDKAREEAKIKADEDALRKGSIKDPQGLSGPGSYIPKSGMKIERGR